MDEEKVGEDFESAGYSTTGINGSVDLVSKPLQEIADEDTLLSPDSFASSGRRKPPKNNNIDHISPNNKKLGHIDAPSPTISVKEAVSKFGGIVDWKAHRVQTSERRRYIEQELDKARDEIPTFNQKSEAAEKARDEALTNLESTKRLIEELKLNLKRAQTEERQAKQDSELAQLRVTELEQGTADESSVAARIQLEVAKARHQSAASELESIKTDLQEIRKDLAALESERDSAVQKAQEAVFEAKEIERRVEDLTIQLITTKESIESTHASRLEAEELRFAEANARDQDALNWDESLKQAEDELEKVKQQMVLAEDLRIKLESASVLLHELKGELAVYMQGQSESNGSFTRINIQSGVVLAKRNLDEVNHNIEKVREEIECLRTACSSLTAKLESEKAVLTKICKQNGLGVGAVTSLESELKRTRTELDDIRKKEKEARDKLTQLPKQLEKVTAEAEKAKSLTEGSRKLLKKAKEAADQRKSEGNTMSTRLTAAQKEIEAARAAEKLALGAISALHESESARAVKKDDLKGGVTISLEEYYELTKRGHEAEEAANKHVADAMARMNEAKELEMQSLNRLMLLNTELVARKEALNVALQKAELAKEFKMNVEEELEKRKREKVEKEEKRKPTSRGLGLFHGLRENLTKENMKKLKDEKNSSKENKREDTQPVIVSAKVAASLKLRLRKKASEVKNKDTDKDKDKDGSVKEGKRNKDKDKDKDEDGETSPNSKNSKKKKKSFGMPKFFMFMGKNAVTPNKKIPHKNS